MNSQRRIIRIAKYRFKKDPVIFIEHARSAIVLPRKKGAFLVFMEGRKVVAVWDERKKARVPFFDLKKVSLNSITKNFEIVKSEAKKAKRWCIGMLTVGMAMFFPIFLLGSGLIIAKRRRLNRDINLTNKIMAEWIRLNALKP